MKANIIKIIGFFAFFLAGIHPAIAVQPIITPSMVNLGSIDRPTTTEVYLINQTAKNLVITKIDADCKCTKTSFLRRPIAPSDSTKISITYTPTPNDGIFYKAIKVYTSTQKEPTQFIIRGTNK